MHEDGLPLRGVDEGSGREACVDERLGHVERRRP